MSLTYETMSLTALQDELVRCVRRYAYDPERMSVEVFQSIVWPLVARIRASEDYSRSIIRTRSDYDAAFARFKELLKKADPADVGEINALLASVGSYQTGFLDGILSVQDLNEEN